MLIKITNLSSSGDGVGIAKDGRKVFVPLTAIGDEVEIKIINENKKIIKGEIAKLIEKSSDRIKPVCKYFGECGGCVLQHLNDLTYYKFKENVIKNAVSYAGYDVPNAIEIRKTGYGCRRRCAFKVHKNKIGFSKRESNEVVNINSCPILEKEIQDLISPINQFLSSIKSVGIREIFLSHVSNGIECVFKIDGEIGVEQEAKIIEFAKKNGLISVGYKRSNDDVIPICKFQDAMLSLGNLKISIPQNSFLQASELGQNHIISEVLKFVHEGDHVLDLYSGIGTYTFPISQKAKFVSAFEGSDEMVKSIKKNAIAGVGGKVAGAGGVRIVAESRDLMNNPIATKELNKFDVVVINPPRNGAGSQAEELAKSSVARIVMVSCNPQTFSRDAKILNDSGYKLTNVVGVDQFYMSKHVEVVGVFRNQKSVI